MKYLSGFIVGLLIFGVAGIANATLVTYDITFNAENGYTGGVGTIVADIETSSVISVEAHLGGITYANHFFSGDVTFSGTDLDNFFLMVGRGVADPQEYVQDYLDPRLVWPALIFSMKKYEYGIFYDDGSYDGDASFEISRSIVPIPGAVWLLGSGLVGLVGARRRLKK